MNRKTSTALIAALALLASPVLAQHGGMGGHGGSHGDMHGGSMMQDHAGMMEHMDTMMDHMSQMMQQMQELHGQLDAEAHGHAGGMGDGPMSAWMQDMEGGIANLTPSMEAMMKSMQDYLQSGDSSLGDHQAAMQDAMTSMDGMVESCRNLMNAMQAMHGGAGRPAGGGHEGHGH